MEILTNHVGQPEPTYRAYVIGGDGRIESAYPIRAASDEEATQAARELVDGHAIELWDRGRKVARFEPESRAGTL